MYSNVGGKIKLVAKLYGWITLIGGLLFFFILLGDYDFIEVIYVPILAVTGFATSWPLYGFGQLIDDVQEIKENSKQRPAVDDPVFHVQIEQARQQAIENRARSEESARRAAEEFQREQQQREREQQKELEEKKTQLLESIDNNQLVQIPENEEERKKLIDTISYATNLAFLSRVRASLKQADLESGQEIIDFLLSLPDDELKPAAQIILMKLNGEK